MDIFRYDFGYGWLWNYGHLLAALPFAAIAVLAWKRRWPRWLPISASAVSVWGLAGLLIVQLAMRMNLPTRLPTDAFLAGTSAEVLDAGAGSGRTSLMVLLARPSARVVALDLYEGYFGIADNTPDRLHSNAALAGVESRVVARSGDMREIPFADRRFGGAVSAYAIDHLDRDGMERSLREIHRVLRPGGEFLLMVVNPDLWVRVAYPFFVHHGYFGGRTDHERWRSRLTAAGFEVLEMGTTPGTLHLLARKPGVDPATTPTS